MATRMGTNARNTLKALDGTHTLIGLAGNDVYYIDSAADRVIEVAGQGTDLVVIDAPNRLSYTLAANVENLLVLDAGLNSTFKGNALGNSINSKGATAKLFGLGGNDRLSGSSGVDADDYLDGGTGADIMQGLSGEDTYIVDNVGDRVIEVNLVGTDVIRSSVSFTLPQYVEKLVLTGTRNVNATGSAADDEILVGNSGANRITGLAGGDDLTGGLGADRFVYTHINDSTFRITGGLDLVRDFSAGQGDTVDLSLLDWNTGNLQDDAFTFIDTAQFTAPGQVRVIENYHNAFYGLDGILVEVNTAGTGSPEMSIFLVGAVGAAESWFNL